MMHHLRLALAALWLSCWLTTVVSAHPFHISLAEMEWNAETGRIEVSLKLHAVDLERALSMQMGEKVNLEKTPLDQVVSDYLSDHFYLTAASHLAGAPPAGDSSAAAAKAARAARSQVRFVGHELQGSWSWLYFELEPPAARPLALVNTVLFELVDGQINTVSVRQAGQRFALKMTEKQPGLEYNSDWLAPAKP